MAVRISEVHAIDDSVVATGSESPSCCRSVIEVNEDGVSVWIAVAIEIDAGCDVSQVVVNDRLCSSTGNIKDDAVITCRAIGIGNCLL